MNIEYNFKGEGEIKGGLFIIGSGKSGIAYQFIERNFGDWAPLAEIIEICTQMQKVTLTPLFDEIYMGSTILCGIYSKEQCYLNINLIDNHIDTKSKNMYVSMREKVVTKVVRKWLYKYHFSILKYGKHIDFTK
jgi:hypothetical protein